MKSKKLFVLSIAALFALSTELTALAASVQGYDGTLKDKLKVSDVTKEVKETQRFVDDLGLKHVRVQQVVQGIPVYGTDSIVSLDKNDKEYQTVNKFSDKAKEYKPSKAPMISKSKALETAKKAVNYDPQNSDAADDVFSNDLYLYNVDGKYIPTYVVQLTFMDPQPGRWKVFVNAENGNIVKKLNLLNDVAATGTGIGVLGDTKKLNLTQSSGTYTMKDTTKAMTGTIVTYDCQNGQNAGKVIVSDKDNVFDATNQRAAVDAHFYAGVVYDYYKTKFNRNSIDGNGMTLKSAVHYGKNYVNAFWNGTQMTYGDGDGRQAVALSGAIDVIAHEMTHGVDEHTANLEYQDQSGAMNEAFSDIFGCLVEDYYRTTYKGTSGNWEMGEEIWTPNVAGDALRSLSDPGKYGGPATMSEYVDTSDDNGGVHTNSTIFGHAGYLVWKQLGTSTTEKIFYKALTTYLTATSNFSDGRKACLQAATDLYGSTSTQYKAVASAFDQVGIK